MLDVSYRAAPGEVMVPWNEPYVSLKEAEGGHLGACGYGEHDA